MAPLVIIPTYNERANLPRLIERLRAATPLATILIVDDNSPDGTGVLADRLAKTDRQLHVLHREEKRGLGRAYQAGFVWALERKFDPICTMDADLSHDPIELPKLLKTIVAGADIALGSRYVAGGKIIGWSWDRYWLSWSANLITRLLLQLRPRDVTAGYKCYRRDFIENLALKDLVAPGYAFQVEMILEAKHQQRKIVEIPITFRDRTIGRSKVSRHELASSARSLLTLVSRRPGLRQMVKFGLVGAMNFVIDVGLTNLLVMGGDWSPILAGYVGTAVALISSFLMNRRWTFRATDGAISHQAPRFLLINGGGALVNAIAYTLLVSLAGLWYNFAKILAIGVSGLWNFFMTKYWVFRDSPPIAPAPVPAEERESAPATSAGLDRS